MSDPLPRRATSAAANTTRIYAVVLAVGLVCALAIAAVYEWTLPVIQRNRMASRQRAILKVLPGAKTSAAFKVNAPPGTIKPTTPHDQGDQVVFAGFDGNGVLVGLAIEAQGMGYQDVVRLLYGYSFAAEAVIGMVVLESRETPGLGDRIETDERFLTNFADLDVSLNRQGSELVNKIEFVKQGAKTEAWQIDGITGATISSRAVSDMISESTARWIPLVHGRAADFAVTHLEANH